MLTKPDVRGAVALVRVKHDADLQAIFTNELNETLKQLATQRDDVVFRQLQGRAQYLFELRELVEKSQELAAKLGA